eukprot:TRINITY_DN5696_c0_g1_i1.p1 TRINITY_DN5696_c0_g1~~TRINITY_DN5696_c0_g1_i1.p1  ORF type:complete len:656 (+),score=53.24 TRINITY_DN5696_c0_g1_i1:50-2017(+)
MGLVRILSNLVLGAVLCTVAYVAYREWAANGVVEARVWRPSHPDFIWPELNTSTRLGQYLLQKENFGIAIGGGGARGHSMAHGVVRALKAEGLLERARYLTTSSGSYWFGAILYYQDKHSFENLLGRSMLPEELTPPVLTSDAMGTAISDLLHSLISKYPPETKTPDALPQRTPNEATVRRLGKLSGRTDQEKQGVSHKDLSRRREAEVALGLPLGTIDKVIACDDWWRHPCACLIDLAVPHTSLENLWTLLSGFLILEPFGLTGAFSTQSHETEVDAVREKLNKLGITSRIEQIYTSKDISQNLPFMVTQSAILAPFTSSLTSNSSLMVFPLEHSAIYSGTPSSHTGEAVAEFGAVGDVLVENIGWPGKVLEPVEFAQGNALRVQRYVNTFNFGQLAELAGIVTAYAADFGAAKRTSECKIEAAEILLPHAMIWSPLRVDSKGVPKTTYAAVGDAGAYDDLGHIPLLRRGVKKIVIFDSSGIRDNSTGVLKANMCEMTYTIAAFGQVGCLDPPNLAGSPNLLTPAGQSAIFEPSEFAPLWEKARALHAAGKPVVVRGTFTVVDNMYLGIVGGWKVEIVWVMFLPINHNVWLNRLPHETRRMIPDYFPNYDCISTKSVFQFGAISQYSDFVTRNYVAQVVRDMVDGKPSGPDAQL